MTVDKSAIRNAATVIVLRDRATQPRILMGQRGAKAAFMPNKFVFPGGAVDKADAQVDLATPLSSVCETRLLEDILVPPITPQALAAAAIRELWEETGQILGTSASWTDPPQDWTGFADAGHRPSAAPLQFVFRALPPPGRPRRFDARFFLANAEALMSDPDDFTEAEPELSHLHWVPVSKARELNLPFITRIVLGELENHLPRMGAPDRVPFVRNEEKSEVIWL